VDQETQLEGSVDSVPCGMQGSRAWQTPPPPAQSVHLSDVFLSLIHNTYGMAIPQSSCHHLSLAPHRKSHLLLFGKSSQSRNLACFAPVHSAPGTLQTQAPFTCEDEALGLGGPLDVAPQAHRQFRTQSSSCVREGRGRAAPQAAAGPRLPPGGPLFLQRDDKAPGRDPRRRPPAAGLAAPGGPKCQAGPQARRGGGAGRHKFLGRNPCESWHRSC
jgi:hypothetical protein